MLIIDVFERKIRYDKKVNFYKIMIKVLIEGYLKLNDDIEL